ncbi:MAG TPA: adenylate/guanylate cyclase domain-containing protein [Acidimicrobiales bacterium]|nr:adenylate/guanylate cyclase domain-containing protein [Acidimicrobiales bacterium]
MARPSDVVIGRAFRRIAAQGTVGGAMVVVYARTTAPLNPDVPRLRNELGALALFVVLLALVVPLARWGSRRRFAHDLAFLDHDRLPTDDERARLLSLPWRTVRWAFRYWCVVAVITAATSTGGPEPFRGAVLNAVAVMYIAVVMSGLAYLVVEQAVRPVLASSGATEMVAERSWIGPSFRLAVAWFLAAALPLGAIALTPLIRARTAPFGLAVPVVFTAVAAIAVGALLHRAVVRSVVDPIESVRAALARVQEGDLSASVPVDDGGELGRLQAGFNRMVDGLRERERIQQLFGRQVGEAVAARALEGGGGELGGEVLEASALFVDLVGSTGLAQRLPPSEVVALLNRFFETVVSCAAAEGGWVNKFAGDGALCVFGAPEAMPDHRKRALTAARHMAAALNTLGREHPEVQAGIGVSSGAVVAGNVGDERRYEYTVIGAPVNEAARLTEEAKGRDGGVLASGSAVTGAGEESAHWEPVGEVELRGIAAPVGIWQPRARQLGL